jgi:hypothetical protein
MNILKGDNLHHVNSALLVCAFLCALRWPFETLLVSYAVLGPLHYLTEISWLHDKGYFLQNSQVQAALWVGLGLLLLTFIGLPFFPTWAPYHVLLLWTVFVALPFFMFIAKWEWRLLALAAIVLAGVVFYGYWLSLFLVVYLVTIIHVFVFTGIFVFNGLGQRWTRAGKIFFSLFVLLPLLCFLLPPHWSTPVSPAAMTRYQGFFAHLNQETLKLWGHPVSLQQVFSLPLSIDLTRFLALAYTYHYLNWFSKPTVIQWHRISAGRWIVIGIAWCAAVGLYAYNYSLGFATLSLLSFSHVILEFPLNHLSFRQLFQGVGRLYKPAA